MEAWTAFWGALLLGTLLFYALLVVYVGIGGLKDIRQMFKTLSEEHGEGEPPSGDD